MAKSKPAKTIKSTDKKKIPEVKKSKVVQPDPRTSKLITRLDKLDNFLLGLIAEEKSVDTLEIMQLLLLKARHIGFTNTKNDSPGNVLVLMFKTLLGGCDEAFSIAQNYVVKKMAETLKKAAKKKKVIKCPNKRSGGQST